MASQHPSGFDDVGLRSSTALYVCCLGLAVASTHPTDGTRNTGPREWTSRFIGDKHYMVGM